MSPGLLGRMRTFVATSMVLGYVLVNFAGIPHVGPLWTTWLLAGASFLFVLCFILIARAHAWVPLVLVLLLTLVFPLVILVAIGWPHYPSFGALVSSYVSALWQHGQLRGFELAVPVFSAVLGWLVAGRLRSHSPLNSRRASGAA